MQLDQGFVCERLLRRKKIPYDKTFHKIACFDIVNVGNVGNSPLNRAIRFSHQAVHLGMVHRAEASFDAKLGAQVPI